MRNSVTCIPRQTSFGGQNEGQCEGLDMQHVWDLLAIQNVQNFTQNPEGKISNGQPTGRYDGHFLLDLGEFNWRGTL
jgi:hypothetical protein